jgi:hypothetical protein
MGTFRSMAARVTLVAGVTVAALGVTAAPAAAYTPYSSGYPGPAATPRIVGQTVDSITGTVFFPTRTVWKSSRYAGYNQQVCVTYNLVYASPWSSTSWQQYRSLRFCGWVTSSSGTVFPGARWTVNGGFFIYSGNVQVEWYLSNGAFIGLTTYDYDQVGDYSCNCTISSSYSLGAYLMI